MSLHELKRDESGPLNQTPELDLKLSDSELLELIKRKIDENEALLKKMNIPDRAEKNVKYWKGRQDPDRKRGMPTTRYSNNIIHRDLATRVQNATSRMPDIVVMSPEQDSDPSVRDGTRKVEEWLNIRVDSDVTRRLAQGAIRDNHLKFRGVWKYRYDHFKKDAITDRLRPEDVVFDATARIPEDGYTVDNMEYIGEWIEESTASVIAKFPGCEDELLAELGREASAAGKPSASKVRYLQSWATVHKKDGTPTEILMHSYNDILLSKGPNPYWDMRGDNDQEFGIIPTPKLHPDVAATLPSLGLDIPVTKPKNYNHFPFARKPYSVFSGENIGDGPMDDTTVVEQSLPMQDIVNMRGDQITAINDWAIPKIVMSTDAMTEEKASSISLDPSEIITVQVKDGDSVQSVLHTFSGEPASSALYQDLQLAIQAMDAHFSTNPVTRGETVTQESGISKQISREGDLSSADDIAQTMVQRCVEEQANWYVQLAKIYFDKPMRAVAPGPDKTLKSSEISREMIPDNIQIVVKANAVDKMTLRNMAMNLMGAKAIDPYTLYQILDFPNPKEMTQLVMDFLAAEASGPAKYLQDVGVNPSEPANQQSETQSQGQPPTVPPQAPSGQPLPSAPPQLANQ